MNFQYAPIVIFAFNRLDLLRNTIASLHSNEEARDSELFIFVDGARANKKGETEKVRAVQEYVKTIIGFKGIQYFFSEENKGLGPSIIVGVGEIVKKFGKVIVLEDDLTLSSNFLSFMNQGLNRYLNEEKIFSICGYSNKISVPKNYIADSYFCYRSSSWGWATWADRWGSVDWELSDWQKYSGMKSAFNKWGGSDCFGMLDGWRKGKNKSWAIRFCFSQFLQNKITLFPVISKVKNNGFDGNGTNCKNYSRFKCDFDITDKKDFVYPKVLDVDKTIYQSAKKYHSALFRLWSALMYRIN